MRNLLSSKYECKVMAFNCGIIHFITSNRSGQIITHRIIDLLDLIFSQSTKTLVSESQTESYRKTLDKWNHGQRCVEYIFDFLKNILLLLAPSNGASSWATYGTAWGTWPRLKWIYVHRTLCQCKSSIACRLWGGLHRLDSLSFSYQDQFLLINIES